MINAPSMRILLVEDNAGDVRLVRELLDLAELPELHLMDVDRLSSALIALNSSQFDVVLLDLSLPDSQGFSTFACLQEQISSIPIILLTGNDDDCLAMKAMKHGAQDYLVKGRFDSDLLLRAIRYSIERQRLLVQMEKAREYEARRLWS